MKLKYHDLMDKISPYIICHSASLDSFDLDYVNKNIRHIDPLDSKNTKDIRKILHLDSLSFGGNDMGMPAWVLFDCAMIPGAVFGFEINSNELSPEDRKLLNINENELFPISMYIAIPNNFDQSWFGHNLSSLNKIISYPLNGLGLLTKFYALKTLKVKKQFGATQWDSDAIYVHTKLAPLTIESAIVSTHTKSNTLLYSCHDFYSKEEVFCLESKNDLKENFYLNQQSLIELQEKILTKQKIKLIAKTKNGFKLQNH